MATDDGVDPIARSIALKDSGQLEAAIAELDRAIASGHDVPRAHYQRGLAFVELGRTDDAIAAYEAALASRPDYVKALVNLAALYNACEQHAKAAALIERAGSLVDADDPVFLVHRAATRRHLGRFSEAIADARAAVAHAPELAETWIELGRGLGSVQRYQDAAEAYTRAVALAPEHIGACHNYAATLDTLGRTPQALPYAEKAYAAEPGNLHHIQTLACCYLHVDRARDALPLLEHVERARPDHFESQYNLACGLAKAGGGERAIPHLRRAIELVPARQRPRFLAHIPDDSDLVSLRELPAFRELVGNKV